MFRYKNIIDFIINDEDDLDEEYVLLKMLEQIILQTNVCNVERISYSNYFTLKGFTMNDLYVGTYEYSDSLYDIKFKSDYIMTNTISEMRNV